LRQGAPHGTPERHNPGAEVHRRRTGEQFTDRDGGVGQQVVDGGDPGQRVLRDARLLAAELGIELRRVGSGKRMTFVQGERALSAWMAENAYVSWIVRQHPWKPEDDVIAVLNLPRNLMGNTHNRFHPTLTEVRAKCAVPARDLPALPNPGTGGR
jgi:hypothetical protein